MYTDVHRAFLQNLASNGCVGKDDALKTLSNIFENFEDEEDSQTEVNEEKLNEIIAEINEKISFLDQKIVEQNYFVLNKDFIIFTNTVEDPINKNQNTYTVADRNYFRLLLKEIATTENHCFRLIVGINLISELKDKKNTKNHANELIHQFINLGYFTINEFDNDDEMVFLGPKGIAEFAIHLKQRYPEDIGECPVCKAVIFYGISCGNSDCNALHHTSCVNERIKHFSDCLSCKGKWAEQS